MFYFFSIFLSKTNYEKCEIAGTGVLKSVKVAVCGMKCVGLCKDTLRITGVHFSYNKAKQDEKNVLETLSKIQNVLKIWIMRGLTLEGKIIVFKTLAISKILYLSMMIRVPTEIIVELKKIQKQLILPTKPKIKQYLLIPKRGVLKMYIKIKR